MAAISIFTFSFTAFADVDLPSAFFDCLSLSGVDGNVTTYKAFTGGTLDCTFDVPISGAYTSIDIKLNSSSSISSASVNGKNLTVNSLGSGLYRLYGTLGIIIAGNFTLHLTFNSNAGWVDFSAVRINKELEGLKYFINSSSITLSVNGGIVGTKYKYNSSDYATISYSPSVSSSVSYFTIDVTPVTSEFKGYDFLTYHLTVRGGSVNSVISGNPNILVDYEVSPFESNNVSFYDIDITMDIRNFDRTSNYVPVVFVQGSVNPANPLLVSLGSCTGFSLTEIDPTPYYIWQFRSFIASVGAKVSALGQQLAEQFVSISKQLSDQFVSISNQLTSLKNTLGSKLDQLIGSSSSAADAFNDNVNSVASDISSSNNVISSISKPDVDQIDIDVSSVVPSADISTYGNILTIPFQSNLILSIFVLSLTFSLVGFVVFGKR